MNIIKGDARLNALSEQLAAARQNDNSKATSLASRSQMPHHAAAQASPRFLLALTAFFLMPLMLISATGPTWWTNPGVLDSNAANDYAALNQGQLKNLATKAYLHLQSNLPVSTWTNAPGTNLIALISSFNTNSPYNYNAVNLGQLKATAQPFYDVLNSIGYTNSAFASPYPWNGATTTNNYAMANIGQAKNLFSFDLSAPSGHIPDWWKLYYFHSITDPKAAEGADPDGDGLTNLQEYLLGSDPINSQDPAPIPATIQKMGGDNQMAPAGTYAPTGLTVDLKDGSGNAISYRTIQFTVTQSNGQLSLINAIGATLTTCLNISTGPDGSATVFAQLPSSTTDMVVTVSAPGTTAIPVVFTLHVSLGIVATPAITADNYYSSLTRTATISCSTPGSSIYYTLNGTEPTTTSSMITTTSGVTPGAIPYAGLTQGSDGNFYGTTYHGGSNDSGTVFKMTPSGSVTMLYSFTGGNDGRYIWAGLIQGSDGNFYGTTGGGGSSGAGTVFKMTSSGSLTTLCSFTSINGATPNAGLIQGSDGNFYGTTSAGGSSGAGTVFKMTSSGSLTTLCTFIGSNGSIPNAGLILGSDGNFYGTTSTGGSSSVGTVFKMTSSGSLTTLCSFTGANGAAPNAGLILGSDGNFYGTTSTGGSNSVGTVFKMTSSGSLTTLCSFTGANGAAPNAGLILGSDGNFYGTTSAGGSNSMGTVFKMTSSGSLTTLCSFTGANGAAPNAGLILGSDGSFYGTTKSGGGSGAGIGTVFKVTSSGVLTTLCSFTGANVNSGTLTITVPTNSSSQTLLRTKAFEAGYTPSQEKDWVFVAYQYPNIQIEGSTYSLTEFSLAKDASGNIWSWGDNSAGQLGIGNLISQTTPQLVRTLSQSLASGNACSLVLGKDGLCYAWGDNGHGQFGNGTFTLSSTAVLVTSNGVPLSNVKSIASAAYRCLALTNNGSVLAWGGTPLGNGTTDSSSIPIQIIPSNVIAIAAGYYGSFALRSDGTIWGWGTNPGNGPAGYQVSPVLVSNITNATAIASGTYQTLALLQNGTVQAWGYNSNGQVGCGSSQLQFNAPVQVMINATTSLSGIVSIGSGGYHSLAVTGDGKLYVWGDNSNGEFGNGTLSTTNTYATLITTITDVMSANCGDLSTLIVKKDGTIWGCGNNVHGQLGIGNTNPSYIPVQITQFDAIDSNGDGLSDLYELSIGSNPYK